jgi:hypothetical protein
MKIDKSINIQELVGKYVNQVLWSDVNPIGKIIGTRGKNILILKKVIENQQLTKLEYEVGGFSAHYSNQYAQKWTFTELDETIELKYTNNVFELKSIDDYPRKFYDYNF